MRCYHHEQEESAAQCSCGRGLCRGCSDRFELVICGICKLESVAQRSFILRSQVLLSASVLVAVTCFAYFSEIGTFRSASENLFQSLKGGYLIASFIWGYIFLSPFFYFDIESGFLFWLALRFVQCSAALLVGPFIAPYMVYRTVRTLGLLRTLKNNITVRPVPPLRLVHS